MKPSGTWLFDATHTSHTRAQTGIQRVCRSLYAALAEQHDVHGVCFDPHQDDWRILDENELTVLRDRTAGEVTSRGSQWSLLQKISGHARRLTDSRPPLPTAHGLVCPELFSAGAGTRLPDLLNRVSGPRIAVFHDAIGLKFPELTPRGTVARLPAYLRELLLFDGVAAVSEDSASCLRDYWQWLGIVQPPPVAAIPLGLDEFQVRGPSDHTGLPRILSVGTIEGRKNHLALLEAAERLWNEGLVFELELIGLPKADTAQAAIDKIAVLRAAGRPLVFHGSVNEASLHKAYARATFTVYPSLMEGFGLPVLESLQHGKPCICSARGALGESTLGGGVLGLPVMDATNLAHAIRHLLRHPAEIANLVTEARARRFRRWRDYADDLHAWMQSLERRLTPA
jgi:glycosyltransferase involved in cell wall biosynthesis